MRQFIPVVAVLALAACAGEPAAPVSLSGGGRCPGATRRYRSWKPSRRAVRDAIQVLDLTAALLAGRQAGTSVVEAPDACGLPFGPDAHSS